jgi:dipeptidase E
MQVAFILSDGNHPNNPKYEEMWRKYIGEHGAKAVKIDNSLRGEDAEIEIANLKNVDAVILTGGNTFAFLNHLKESGLDKALVDFARSNKIIVGFSAGAIILSQSIQIVELPDLDENVVGIQDLSGLGLIDFDIFPHYVESKHKSIVDEYEKQADKTVKRLKDNDIIILNYEPRYSNEN